MSYSPSFWNIRDVHDIKYVADVTGKRSEAKERSKKTSLTASFMHIFLLFSAQNLNEIVRKYPTFHSFFKKPFTNKNEKNAK